MNVIFAFDGFPGAVHQLIHGRPNTNRFHVRGFIEQGTTTTPFDMTVKNRVSRFHLVMDAIHNSPHTPRGSADLLTWCARRLHEHEGYVIEHLEDLPTSRIGLCRRSHRPTETQQPGAERARPNAGA